MLNNVTLVGRISEIGELIKEENGERSLEIIIAVPRSHKSDNGEYETDFIETTLTDSMAINTKEYCNKGDLIGIKGRLEVNNGKLVIMTERLTFLSSKSKEINKEIGDKEYE